MGEVIQFGTKVETVESIDAQIAALEARKQVLLTAAAERARELMAMPRSAPVPITSKVRKHRGTIYGGDHTGMFAQFSKNEDGKTVVHLTGRYGNWKDVDIKFTEGDTAIYDSYNFDYLGEILSITEKTVLIKEQYGSRNHRLDLATFANRNYDFDLERSHKRRMEWSD
jgi:hypothetical protein